MQADSILSYSTDGIVLYCTGVARTPRDDYVQQVCQTKWNILCLTAVCLVFLSWAVESVGMQLLVRLDNSCWPPATSTTTWGGECPFCHCLLRLIFRLSKIFCKKIRARPILVEHQKFKSESEMTERSMRCRKCLFWCGKIDGLSSRCYDV